MFDISNTLFVWVEPGFLNMSLKKLYFEKYAY